MRLDEARALFPGLADKTFFDAACVSLAPRPATDAIRHFLDLAELCPAGSATLHHIAMDHLRSAARPAAAQLIGAQEDEIALVESTTHGLALAADSIPLQPGDQVLLSDLEFLQVAAPWYQQPGIEVVVVPHRDGRVLAQDFASRLSSRSRVICLSTVQWSNGFRCDLAAFSDLARRRGLWLVVDAVQQLGAFPIDLRQTPVDLLCCGGHKWLNSPFGCGFLYLHRDTLARLKPSTAGYLSLEPPQGGWGQYFQTPSISPAREYRFVPEARRYEIGGTSNYPGAIGLAASLRLILDLGQDAIAAHIRSLTDQLIAGLDALPRLRLVTPRDPVHRSGIVTFTTGSQPGDLALMQRLLDRRIYLSVRYTSNVGGLRVSCHFFNSPDDIARLLAALALERRAASPGEAQ